LRNTSEDCTRNSRTRVRKSVVTSFRKIPATRRTTEPRRSPTRPASPGERSTAYRPPAPTITSANAITARRSRSSSCTRRSARKKTAAMRSTSLDKVEKTQLAIVADVDELGG
jgi:hypothetical protein